MIKDQFYKIITIGDQIINESENIHPRLKESMLNYSQDIIRRINDICKNGKPNATIINAFKKDYLIFWNETVSIESEMFWQKLANNNIEFKRNEPLKYALTKNRFLNVHQGKDARKNWKEILDFGYINHRFTKDEIAKLGEIIDKDEKDRLELLKKCYQTKKIPKAQYLRFGDSVAYFNNSDLFKKYFKSDEVVELISIWTNFK